MKIKKFILEKILKVFVFILKIGLLKSDNYFLNNQDFSIPVENSDLNTNYEKSNFSNLEYDTNFNISNTNKTLNNTNEIIIDEKIFRMKNIIANLKNSLKINFQIQKLFMQKYERLSKKQLIIEQTIEKIKRIKKSKQKKHIKYLKYTPLNKVYYYCPKKIHYYYILMDLVIKSRKKNKQINNSNFHFSLGGNNSNVSKKNDINRFKFIKKEDAILKKILLFSISEDNIDWNEITREIHTKNAFQVFVRSLELSNFYAYKKWNIIEDNILRKAILYYGPKNWQQISYCLDGRNNSQCFHRWMKGINPKIKRNKWSFEEDLTLGVALRIYGNKKWSKIANHLNGRTDIQCRERFCNILDPNLEEVEWKSSEDIKLLSLYEKYGNKWSKIAKEFGNRTDNTCWRRWKYLISIKNFEVSGFNSNMNTNTNLISSNCIIKNNQNSINVNNNANNIRIDNNTTINLSNLNTPTTINNTNIKNVIEKIRKTKGSKKVTKEAKSKEEENKYFDNKDKNSLEIDYNNKDFNGMNQKFYTNQMGFVSKNKFFVTNSQKNTYNLNYLLTNLSQSKTTDEFELLKNTNLNDVNKSKKVKYSYIKKRHRNKTSPKKYPKLINITGSNKFISGEEDIDFLVSEKSKEKIKNKSRKNNNFRSPIKRKVNCL